MNTPTQTLYVTTAIPFVNSDPHLGFALELCIADAYARHARSRGTRVKFVTGTDDHSLKNVLAAERAGVATREFVAQCASRFQQLAAALQISTDAFVSTSRHDGHAAAVCALWHACAARGDLYKQAYRGLYCAGCERFGDPGETQCAEHQAPLEFVEETNWFFRLSRYQNVVRDAISSGRLSVSGGAREETLAFLREPLRDVCVSRSAERARNWGLCVPGDDSQVIWVWFDALAYYLSALGYAVASEDYETFWASDTPRLHVIGKGVARFHAVLWPAILESAGLPWPTRLWVHGYLTLDGSKISKSSGRALDPGPWLAHYGSDALRYYLLRHVRAGRDADFRAERFDRAYHSELANGFGNLVNRVFGLVARANGSAIPRAGTLSEGANALRAATLALPAEVDACAERFAFCEALDAVFGCVDAANKLIDQSAPWAAIRDGRPETTHALLRELLETLRVIAAVASPFLPDACERLQRALGVAGGSLCDGAVLPATLALFPRREAFGIAVDGAGR